MRRKRASQLCFVVLGLLSVALHASLLAWHPFAHFRTPSADVQLVADLGKAICHGGRDAEPTEPPADDGAPIPKSDCLFCNGVANPSLAILPGTETGPLARACSRIAGPVSFRAVAAAVVIEPRSRGPPQLV